MIERLADYTTLKVGGPAQVIHAKSEAEIIDAISSADGKEILILGGGSNLLVGDDGFSGLVIKIENKGNSYEIDACSGGLLTVAAGEDWDEFVQFTMEKGLANLESLSGIPLQAGHRARRSRQPKSTSSLNIALPVTYKLPPIPAPPATYNALLTTVDVLACVAVTCTLAKETVPSAAAVIVAPPISTVELLTYNVPNLFVGLPRLTVPLVVGIILPATDNSPIAISPDALR